MDRQRSAVGWRGLRLALATAVTAAFAAAPAGAGATVKRLDYCSHQSALFKGHHPYLGVSDGTVQAENPQLQACSLGQMAAHGVGYYRAAINWAGTEYYPGAYNFLGADALVAAVARHHMHLEATLIGAPRWLSTDPPADTLDTYPPANPAQFGDFAALCVQRYGPHGTFWRENPKLPYYPVRAWQIWNEPNLAEWWVPRPDVTAYVRLLQASYRAIKHADRHAVVVTGGMPFFSPAAEAAFLSQMYRAGMRGYFDALSIHPYAATLDQAYQRLLVARKVMNRFKNARKALWITEVGWAGGDPNGFLTNPRRQRAQMAAFLAWVGKNRARLRLREVIWYGWVDVAVPTTVANPAWWAYHLGVFTGGLQPKPVLWALTKAARRLDR